MSTRTELQYNLQRARALATELRCTMDTLDELLPPGVHDMMKHHEAAWEIEAYFDDLPKRFIGEGHVKLTIEENT